jgi:hypothetical protein
MAYSECIRAGIPEDNDVCKGFARFVAKNALVRQAIRKNNFCSALKVIFIFWKKFESAVARIQTKFLWKPTWEISKSWQKMAEEHQR